MTKKELELSQSFNELELSLSRLRVASTTTSTMGPQKHSYWNFYIENVEKSLAVFKEDFYNIMLDESDSDSD